MSIVFDEYKYAAKQNYGGAKQSLFYSIITYPTEQLLDAHATPSLCVHGIVNVKSGLDAILIRYVVSRHHLDPCQRECDKNDTIQKVEAKLGPLHRVEHISSASEELDNLLMTIHETSL